MKAFVTGDCPFCDLSCEDVDGPQAVDTDHPGKKESSEDDSGSNVTKFSFNFEVLWLELVVIQIWC